MSESKNGDTVKIKTWAIGTIVVLIVQIIAAAFWYGSYTTQIGVNRELIQNNSELIQKYWDSTEKLSGDINNLNLRLTKIETILTREE